MKKIAPFAILAFLLAGTFYFKSRYDEWFVYPALRASVNDQLKDPSSTQFRNERITNGGYLCGELNSKNGNGGYVGFKRYISGANVHYLEGIGSIRKQGEIASTSEVLEMLNKENEILRDFIEMRNRTPDIQPPSDDARRDLVIRRIFEGKWKEFCTH